MKQMSQADAVFQATTEILEANGIEWDGKSPIQAIISKELRGEIHDRVVAMFQSGETAFRQTDANAAKLGDVAKLKTYVVGLVSNHFRKDKRLNGGTQYVAKNPGSRSSDPQVREMKKLLASYEEGTEEYQTVLSHIEARQAELEASRAKSIKPVDTSKLPEALRATLGIN